MKKFKLLSVFLLLISIINILFPQEIFAAKTKYVLVAEYGDSDIISYKEWFSPDDKDINFERLNSYDKYNFKCTYNKKGQLTKAVMKHDLEGNMESVNSLTYTYDKKGRLIEKNSSLYYTKLKKTVNSVYTYTYNKKNQLLQIKKVDKNTSKTSDTYKYSYHSNGKIKSITKKLSVNNEIKKWTFYSSGIIKSFTRTLRGEKLDDAKYDSHGNITECMWIGIHKGKKAAWTEKYKNVYNNDILEKTNATYYSPGSKEPSESEITYYTEGTLKGEIKEEKWHNSSGEVTRDEIYKYKLDSSGENIIRKQKYSLYINGEKNLEYTKNYKWKKITVN